ncbi:BtrH N-terminal domain-containing protein [Nocardia terpenica]|uniref:Uncharacterized protein n=1 Tax=Nocardia terpenica TaxID=455432 RepID=A0A6G9ZBU2_9NOCA|nr:BtrH N-terminal domain-containing protein [Nocardia terpenica]QIS22914.1 hypothetical protein F6W96_35825 [Nocardia terpenica]
MDARKLLVDNKFEVSNDLLPYIGSGPYCYSNALVMMLGEHAPSPAVLEVLTGSPFGMVLLAGRTPFFDPYGWTPEIGMDLAMSLLGWTCRRESGGTGDEAAQRLRRALARGPVLVGPVEIGLLRYHPDMHGPIGSDHYVVALGIELGALGLDRAAATAAEQARLVGSLQYDLVTGDFAAAARTLRELAPSYDRLAHASGRATS